MLSPCNSQIAHALLTRPPLGRQEQAPSYLVRLACLKHAASVRPEPGSNSIVKLFTISRLFRLIIVASVLDAFFLFPELDNLNIDLFKITFVKFVVLILKLFNFQGSR